MEVVAKVDRSASVGASEWLRSWVDIGSSDNCGVIHHRETAAARAILGQRPGFMTVCKLASPGVEAGG